MPFNLLNHFSLLIPELGNTEMSKTRSLHSEPAVLEGKRMSQQGHVKGLWLWLCNGQKALERKGVGQVESSFSQKKGFYQQKHIEGFSDRRVSGQGERQARAGCRVLARPWTWRKTQKDKSDSEGERH